MLGSRVEPPFLGQPQRASETEIQFFVEKVTDGAVIILERLQKEWLFLENVTERKSEKEFLDSNILLLENETLFTEKDYWIL